MTNMNLGPRSLDPNAVDPDEVDPDAINPDYMAQLEEIDPELFAQLEAFDEEVDPTLLERGVSRYNIDPDITPEEVGSMGELTDIRAALEGREPPVSVEMEQVGLGGVEQAVRGAGEQASQAALNMTTLDPIEVADMLTSRFPDDIEIVLSEEGHPVARNRHKWADIQEQLDNGEITPREGRKLREDAEWIINRPGLSPMDGLQALGTLAVYSPAGRVAMTPLRTMTQGLTGQAKRDAVKSASRAAAARGVTLEGTTEYWKQRAEEEAGGRFDLDEIAFSAATAAVPEYVITPGATAMRKTYNLVKDNVTIPHGVQRAIDYARKTGRKIATSDVLLETIKAPRMMFLKGSERIPLIGTGDVKLRQAREREDSLEDLFNHFGLVGETEYDAYIASAFLRQSRKVAGSHNALRTDAFDALVPTGQVTPKSFMNGIDDELDAVGKLDRDEQKSLMNWLNSTRQDFEGVMDGSVQFNFKDADIKLASMARTADDGTLKGQAKLRLIEALKKDMKRHANGIGEGGIEAYNKWDLARNLGLKELRKVEDKALKEAIRDNKGITPSLVDRLLKTGDEGNLDALYRRTDKTGRDLLRKRVMAQAFKKARGEGKDINLDRLVDILGKDPATVRAIKKYWSKEDREMISGFKQYIKHTKQAGKKFEGMGILSAGAAENGGRKMIAGAIAALMPPTWGVVAAARAHESDIARDILLKLHHADASPLEERILYADLRELFISMGSQIIDEGRDPFAAEIEPTMVEKVLGSTGQIGKQLYGAVSGFRGPWSSPEDQMEMLREATGQSE